MSSLPLHFPLRKLDRDAHPKRFLAPEVEHPEWGRAFLFDFLYRFYDADLQPVYFGISAGSASRWDQHRKRADWWPLAEYVAVSFYPAYEAVQAAEKAAIRHEKPRYNKQFSRWPASIPLRCDQRAEHAAEQIFRDAPPEFIAELATLLAQPERFPQPQPPPAAFADGPP